MSSQPRTHVLVLDEDAIHEINARSRLDLHSIWTFFSRCADSVEQGRRLENLSWRAWQRETLVISTQGGIPIGTLPRITSTESQIPNVPQLSNSVETLMDDNAADLTSVPEPSGTDHHNGPSVFGGMLYSIIKNKNPLPAPLRPVHIPELSQSVPSESPIPYIAGSPISNTKAPEVPRQPSPKILCRTNVVCGFNPGQKMDAHMTPALTQSSSDTVPQPTLSPAAESAQYGKPTWFQLGGSCSMSEQDQSMSDGKPVVPIIKKPMFQIGGSSEVDGFPKSATASSRPSSMLSPRKKQASFSSNVMTRTNPDNQSVVDSDTNYIDESAIVDDDDSSDWEDSVKDSGKSSMDDVCFQRVDSKPVLTSRQSLITQMLTQNERGHTLGNHASQSTSAIPRSRVIMDPSLGTSPNGSDDAPLTMKNMRGPGLEPIHEVPRSNARPIMVGTNHAPAQAALSPRTTRRNMLATEITESLRRHLLWERQQKTSTANAVLKRRHTSHDVANLNQYPEEPCMRKSEDVHASSWNRYFSKEAFDGYHSKGW